MAKTRVRKRSAGAPGLRPLGENVLVERLQAEEKTAGGIVLPDKAREKPQRGKVLAVGDGKLLDDGTRAKPLVKQGENVIFGKYSGTEIKHNGREYLLISESDILAVEE